MSKSKRSPALFELLDKRSTSSKLAVPNWFKGSNRTDTQDSAEETTVTKAPPKATVKQPKNPKPAPKISTSASRIPTNEHPPILRIESGRVEISLNPINAAVVVGVALLTLFSSYLIGQSVGVKRSSPEIQTAEIGRTDDIQQALNQPPDPRVLDVANRPKTLMQERTYEQPKPKAEPKKSNMAATTSVKRTTETAGPEAIMNYIVVESFNPAHKKSAEFVQKWLAEQGLETELKKSGNRWLLVTTYGYDITQDQLKTARDQLIENLKLNGPACAEALRNEGLPEYGLKGPYATRKPGG